MKPLPLQHLRAPQLTAPQPTGQKKASAPATSEEMAIAAASSNIRDMRPTAGLRRKAEEAIVRPMLRLPAGYLARRPSQSSRYFLTISRPYGFTIHLSPASHHPHGPDAAAGHSVSASTKYAQKVQPASGSMPVIAPVRDESHLGVAQRAVAEAVDAMAAQGPRPIVGPKAAGSLIDAAAWNAMTSAELVGAAGQLHPMGVTAACVQYAGPDLFWAQPLQQELLDQLYQPPAGEFKAGMGFNNQPFWRELAGSNTEVSLWVTQGYSEFVPGFEGVPTIVRANNENTGGENEEFVDVAVAELMSVGAVRDVTDLQHDPSVVRAVCPLTVAVQASGKKRLCWNGRPVNEYIPHTSFKMEHAEVAARMMRPGDYMMVVDMKAGYHQMPVKPGFRKLLCFAWKGKVYQWRVMPFGLSSAPRAYSKLARCLLKRWRAMGIRCMYVCAWGNQS
ncbi:hypothetical protein OEZ85_008574 [Tetradesmus obliquus]|uniref:Reverse transcriptase domain-containing protein n=1 Tax=Tetradesmus obliquus TaxID=3088 RepID=A0ABY8TJ75_TETOB|nr:hypothetical protein OEZ85_008574 [Tetradesmus obliquus]